jgi:hypothetical protein
MIYAGIHNENLTNNYPMCDVVLQSHASSISWMQVVSIHFSSLVNVSAQFPNIHVYFNPLPNFGHKSP